MQDKVVAESQKATSSSTKEHPWSTVKANYCYEDDHQITAKTTLGAVSTEKLTTYEYTFPRHNRYSGLRDYNEENINTDPQSQSKLMEPIGKHPVPGKQNNKHSHGNHGSKSSSRNT